MRIYLIAFAMIALPASCEIEEEKPNLWDSLADRFHKAYVTILNTETGEISDSTAHVFTDKGNVVKICFPSDSCVTDFDMWVKNEKSQEVYSTSKFAYTVRVIAD